MDKEYDKNTYGQDGYDGWIGRKDATGIAMDKECNKNR